jgi:hypothetical protein
MQTGAIRPPETDCSPNVSMLKDGHAGGTIGDDPV